VVRHGQDAPPAQHAAGQEVRPDRRDVAVSVARMMDNAQCDQLTGLLNRRLLRDRLRHAMDRANRNQRLLALVLMDINNFKEVNHAFGYEAGDALLAKAAATIRGCLRDSDSVARWGGDEFVALLEDLNAESDAQRVAEKIAGLFNQPLQAGGRECPITLSVGVALYPAADCDLDCLLKRADFAMRAASAMGPNSVQLYSADAGEPQSERLALKTGLRDALREGQLFIEY
jgi:diguanylate cyclase (GGDEF)-like protein